MIDGSGRIQGRLRRQIERLKEESSLCHEKAGAGAAARNHTHSGIRHQHHERKAATADITLPAPDKTSSAEAAAGWQDEGRQLLERETRLRHPATPTAAAVAVAVADRQGQGQGQDDVPPGDSSDDSSHVLRAAPADVSGSASTTGYVLHVPPLSPVLHPHHHLHHHHASHHRYPVDYQQMRHYNDMRAKPNNVSLVVMQWSPPAVRVSWLFNESEHGVNMHTKIIPKKLEAFRITYHPTNSR